MDWGPEGFCAFCHTLVPLDKDGNKAKHLGSWAQSGRDDSGCAGGGQPPDEHPENDLDPWEG